MMSSDEDDVNPYAAEVIESENSLSDEGDEAVSEDESDGSDSTEGSQYSELIESNYGFEAIDDEATDCEQKMTKRSFRSKTPRWLRRSGRRDHCHVAREWRWGG